MALPKRGGQKSNQPSGIARRTLRRIAACLGRLKERLMQLLD